MMSEQHPRLRRKDHLPAGRHFLAKQHAGEVYPVHAHEYYELELVIAGCGGQRLNGKEMRLERGSVYLLSPGDFHEITASQDLILWNISFDEQFISPELCRRMLGALPFVGSLSGERLDRTQQAMTLLCTEPEEEAARLLMQYIFHMISNGEGSAESLTPVGRAAAYLDAHFREPVTLAQVAAIACLSPVYFGACFHREMGCTYVEYRNRCRVECARMLLEHGVSVTETCFQSGFGSLSGFLYTFRQYTGMSPQAYRIEKSKNNRN